MKNLLLGTTVALSLVLMGGSAFAADMMKGVVEAPQMAAPSGLYVSVFGGAAMGAMPTGIYSTSYLFSLPTTTGYVIGGAIGTHIDPNLRGELEVSYASHGVTGNMFIDGTTQPNSGSFNTLYVLGNLWYDFNVGSSFTPYLGGGAGVAVLMPNLDTYTTDPGAYLYNTSTAAAAFQVGAGVKMQLSDNIALDLGYRAKYVYNASLTESGTSGDTGTRDLSYLDQTIQAGLTFGF